MDCVGVPWNSAEYYGLSLSTMDYRGEPWNIMDYFGLPWSTMEYHKLVQNIVKYRGLFRTNSVNCRVRWNTTEK